MRESPVALLEAEPERVGAACPTASLRIDLSAVELIDPSTLRALWNMSRSVHALGCRIHIHDPNGVLVRTSDLLDGALDHASPTERACEGTPAPSQEPAAEE